MFYTSDSKVWSILAAPGTGGILLEMQGLRPHSRPTTSDVFLTRSAFVQDLYAL